jgi:hypothetical protein
MGHNKSKDFWKIVVVDHEVDADDDNVDNQEIVFLSLLLPLFLVFVLPKVLRVDFVGIN